MGHSYPDHLHSELKKCLLEGTMVPFAADSATVITKGDLLYQDTDDVKPAASQADQLSLANNQVLFASKWAGIAMESKPAGVAKEIMVQVAKVVETDCASSTFEVGDLIGAVEKSNGTQLESQKVSKVSTTDMALGRCVRRSATTTTRVRWAITSTVLAGGVMPPA